MMDRFARVAIPDNRRFALIRDADRGDRLRAHAGMGQGLTSSCQLSVPDRFGIVFHFTGARQDLRKFLLRGGDDAPRPIEQDRAAGGRALIECQDVVLHAAAPKS